MSDTFDAFDLNQTTLSALEAMGFDQPTDIQVEAIPHLLAGRDLVAQARTGTGKTAAFGIPVVDGTRGKGIQTLVMAPTRELANQVTKELNAIGKGSAFKAQAIYGGVGYGRQKAALRGDNGVTCIVACPGRLLDLLDSMNPDLSQLNTVILDEADRMLDMGFIHDIRKILAHLPKKRQMILTSATMPQGIREIAKRYQNDAITVQASQGPLATPLTEQFYVPIQGNGLAPLLTLLDKEEPERTVVFTETKHTAKRMAAKLSASGYRAKALQGNMSQSKRDKAMAAFRDGKTNVLVATDVAARGIDVEELTHVIQFDTPQRPEDHVHRTGRTGRAGRNGRAFLLAQPQQKSYVRKIEKHAGITLEHYDLGPLVQVPNHVAKAGPKPRNYESVAAGGRGKKNRRY